MANVSVQQPKAKGTSNKATKAKKPTLTRMPKVEFVTFFSSFKDEELVAIERIYDFLPQALQDALDGESIRRSAGQRLIPAAEVLKKLR
jgi:hypothetical protein